MRVGSFHICDSTLYRQCEIKDEHGHLNPWYTYPYPPLVLPSILKFEHSMVYDSGQENDEREYEFNILADCFSFISNYLMHLWYHWKRQYLKVDMLQLRWDKRDILIYMYKIWSQITILSNISVQVL